MKIEINIPKMMCDVILERNKYVSEKVTLYYSEVDNDYHADDSFLRPNHCVVAYPEGMRPEILDDEYPMMEDCEDIMYDRVVEDLFNSWLLKTMMLHDPLD